jgi:hypothetical protein
MASSVVQAGSPLDDYFNGESAYQLAPNICPGLFWGEVKTDVVDEVEMSSETDSSAPPFGAEEAGDTVSTTPVL